ncbi:neutral/alkaline non-lysosomal ceramidase N-terminal domain-containing protein [Prosthecobacter fluviatilis]|uniref:Neutral/alkaline non-lysosomal ceramidase N-terminal domain-containing protein n=1 Tax=Prosthecobacter fluviatilis TaxID=445931 RepID=A0ABW0KRE8_9BACT
MNPVLPILAFAFASFLQTSAQTPEWKAAAASTVITPTEPMYLAGFANREVPAEGTAMELNAKALALQDAQGQRFVMVTLDLVEVTAQLRDAVAEAVKTRFSLPEKALLLNCSHTHCGPELRYTELEFMNFSDPLRKERCLRYNAWLRDRIIAIIGESLQQLEPATVSYGHARCGFAMNRRLKNDKPSGDPYLNSPNPGGVVDHDVPVLTVQTAAGKLSAIVFGYACHNTSMSIRQWHGDYAGHAQQLIEEAHPGTIALFMMGCGGDQNAYPRFSPIFSLRHGQSLATAVEAALDAKPKPIRGPLRIDWQTTRLDYQSIPTADQIEKRLSTGEGYEKSYEVYQRKWDEKRLYAIKNGGLSDHYDYPLQVVHFGHDLTFVALSGETCVDYSLRLKREFKGPGALWVAGYSNDILAYIPSRRVLLEGGYEAFRSLMYWSNPLHPDKFADTLEERIISTAQKMMK